MYNTINEQVNMWEVELGDFTFVSSNCRINKVKIGKFCSIGYGVQCGIGRHPSRHYVTTHPIFYSMQRQAQITFSDRDYFEEFRKTEIGNDVWIGANAIILDGVKIGDGSIVGAGSVVTKDVLPYAIVGGVPARVIRYRFDESQIQFLLKFQWWNKDLHWLRRHFKQFHDIDNMINYLTNTRSDGSDDTYNVKKS